MKRKGEDILEVFAEVLKRLRETKPEVAKTIAEEFKKLLK